MSECCSLWCDLCNVDSDNWSHSSNVHALLCYSRVFISHFSVLLCLVCICRCRHIILFITGIVDCPYLAYILSVRF